MSNKSSMWGIDALSVNITAWDAARCTTVQYLYGTVLQDSNFSGVTLFITESLENDCILQIPYFELFLLFWNFDEWMSWTMNNLLTMNVINIQHHTTSCTTYKYITQITNLLHWTSILNLLIKLERLLETLHAPNIKSRSKKDLNSFHERRCTRCKVQVARHSIIPYTSTSICPTRIRIANLSQTWHF